MLELRALKEQITKQCPLKSDPEHYRIICLYKEVRNKGDLDSCNV